MRGLSRECLHSWLLFVFSLVMSVVLCCAAKACEGVKNAGTFGPLKSLLLDGFQSDQIWEEIQLQNKPACLFLNKEIERLVGHLGNGEEAKGTSVDDQGEDEDEDEGEGDEQNEKEAGVCFLQLAILLRFLQILWFRVMARARRAQ